MTDVKDICAGPGNAMRACGRSVHRIVLRGAIRAQFPPPRRRPPETRAALEESHARHTELYDFAPVAYFTFNANGAVTDVNPAGTSSTKTQPLPGRFCTRMVPP
jgi:hypothetical protein